MKSVTQPREDKESWRHTNPNRQWGQHLQVIFLALRQRFWHSEFLEKQIFLMEMVNQLLKNYRVKEGICYLFTKSCSYFWRKKKSLKNKREYYCIPCCLLWLFCFFVKPAEGSACLKAWQFFLAISADLIKDITSPCKTCISWNIIPLQSTLG